jgi:hypothetical protein
MRTASSFGAHTAETTFYTPLSNLLNAVGAFLAGRKLTDFAGHSVHFCTMETCCPLRRFPQLLYPGAEDAKVALSLRKSHLPMSS